MLQLPPVSEAGATPASFTRKLNASDHIVERSWAWLSVAQDGSLFISSTPNQDNPTMQVNITLSLPFI
jgi:superoxide dismutase